MNELALFQHATTDQADDHARAVVRRAAGFGVAVQYLGLHPLFEEVRVYQGEGRDWVLAPAQLDPVFLETGGHYPIPKPNLLELRRLVDGDLNFQAIYFAHDIAPGRIELPPAKTQVGGASPALASRTATIIPLDLARQVVPTVPQPRRTLESSRRYGRACELMLKAVGILATSAIGIAVAPLYVLPSIFQGLGEVDFVDPIVFGAVPLGGEAIPGTPAAWFVLTRWSY